MLGWRKLFAVALVAALVTDYTSAGKPVKTEAQVDCIAGKSNKQGIKCTPTKAPTVKKTKKTKVPTVAPTTAAPTTAAPATTPAPTPYKAQPAPVSVAGVSSYNWCGDRKWIALTFDDFFGQPALSDLLADLKTHKMPASFFVAPGQGGLDPNFCASLQTIVDAGHEVNSHTYSHPDMTSLNASMRSWEMDTMEEIVYTKCGVKRGAMKQFRPPYGSLNRDIALELNQRGYTVVSWTYDAQDWDGSNMTTVWERSLERHQSTVVGNGSAVVLHHTWAYTASGTKGIIAKYHDHYAALGYKFVTAQECFAACLEDGGESCKMMPNPGPGVYDAVPAPVTTA